LAIAGNRCRTLLAKRGRRLPTQPLNQSLQDAAPDVQAARQLAEEVHLALTGVREEYRRAFMLFHKEELSYAEIAAALDCPLGTVKTWVRRARQELIKRLSQREVLQEPVHAMR
jgi:RNA polymerase sigma-70 factor (ECF subfamily)